MQCLIQFTDQNTICKYLEYILIIMIERLNCNDIENTASLPEVMRPPPT